MNGNGAIRTLSVLVPIYNERHTVERLLRSVAAVDTGLEVEILAGDDGSTDGTRDILQALRLPGLRVVLMDRNVGRGGVIKHLWSLATGDVLLHQDADLEYDPADYPALLAPLVLGSADVVYGSRFKGHIAGMRWLNRLGNHTMSAATRALYGVRVSDLMTCYKAYRRTLVTDLHIDADGFDFEAEFTARLAQRGARFTEVPIRFAGRTFEEGKKIRAVDAVRVMRELVRCKVTEAARG
ncbi:glycosyl transferase [Luteitalea sp. TBR-22]|uniref:glycosyltransferase family 2 protein n=1 Tax=Luteitalea sp. TBR-22 TaxID=2802971 RepID=UPI001AF641CA|nr:glycosyltransferase family 2 protein [Luteitalea sp. TBR-22]BCS33278.1 glycosyl transferase [Luteitalea sp. TBR-22]